MESSWCDQSGEFTIEYIWWLMEQIISFFKNLVQFLLRFFYLDENFRLKSTIQ